MPRTVYVGATILVAVLLLSMWLVRANRTSGSPSEKLWTEYRAVQIPEFDHSRDGDQAYVQQYRQQLKAAELKRAKIAKRFYEAHPNNPHALTMLLARWEALPAAGASAQVFKETNAYMKAHLKMVGNAKILFVRAMAALQSKPIDFQQLRKTVEAYCHAAPKNRKGALLLYLLASHETERKAIMKTYGELIKQYPTTQYTQMAQEKIDQIKKLGQPFKLSFTGAITGKHVSIAKMKGKVVVVDFWATWCPLCMVGMPHMKKLYAKWHDKGVDFIGVNLNRSGGLKALKHFVKVLRIPWPQYYQGHGWTSAFSSKWHVKSLPTVFVVNQRGRLYSVTARDHLTTLLPKLLAQTTNQS